MARDRASRPEAKPLRLLVAFDVPPAVRDAAESSVAPWRERFPRAKWVPKQNQHVTLKFLGATWPRLVPWVHGTVAAVAREHAPVPTRVLGLGAFPNAHRARVLWVGLDDGKAALARIAASLDEGLSREFAPEKRGFTPHLTIARFDPPVALEGLADAEMVSEPFDVGRIVLFRSHLRRPAPLYDALATFPLASRASG
ncbi:MAG: RNA 2',3'-cyclic phosphodiesterase [Actinomycetota bacterium]